MLVVARHSGEAEAECMHKHCSPRLLVVRSRLAVVSNRSRHLPGRNSKATHKRIGAECSLERLQLDLVEGQEGSVRGW